MAPRYSCNSGIAEELPIKNPDGEIIGAIGVSGSTVEDDHAVAEAGAAAI